MNTTDKLVELTTAPTDLEAAMIIAALEREGIEAFMRGEYTASFRAEAPGWPAVQVREGDLERAQRVLGGVKLKSDPDVDVHEITSEWSFRALVRLSIVIGFVVLALVIANRLIQSLSPP